MRKNLTEIIENVLKDHPETRDNDAYLYYEVCKIMSPLALEMPYGVVVINPKLFHVPGYDTVTRLRRKIQAELEDVQASDQVQAWRSEREDRCRVGCFE